MEQLLDPRAQRTRQLIIEAFNSLLQTRDFEKISIKDLTEMATINRATFYAHFVDKYALLEAVLVETIQQTFARHLKEEDSLNAESIEQLFLAIVHLHDDMYAGCRRGYNTFTSMIEEKTKDEIVLQLQQLAPTLPIESATMLSWALYGSYVQWYKTSKEMPVQFVQRIMPHLLLFVAEV